MPSHARLCRFLPVCAVRCRFMAVSRTAAPFSPVCGVRLFGAQSLGLPRETACCRLMPVCAVSCPFVPSGAVSWPFPARLRLCPVCALRLFCALSIGMTRLYRCRQVLGMGTFVSFLACLIKGVKPQA